VSFSVITGRPLSPTVDLVGEAGALAGAPYSPVPMETQTTFIALVGARWTPFRPLTVQAQALTTNASGIYLQADFGYTELIRDTTTGTATAGRGVALGTALGWLAVQAHEWGLGFELENHLAVFNGGEGVRDSLSLLALVQLYLPWYR
jgi:hypothetical protein